jgi:hypothetical protein
MDRHKPATEIEPTQPASPGWLDEVVHSRPVEWANENRMAAGAIAVGGLALGALGIGAVRSMARDVAEFKAAQAAAAPVGEHVFAPFGESAIGKSALTGGGQTLARQDFAGGHALARQSAPLGEPTLPIDTTIRSIAESSVLDYNALVGDNFRFAHSGSAYDSLTVPVPEAPQLFLGHDLDAAVPGSLGGGTDDQVLQALHSAIVDDGVMNFHYGLAAHEAMPDLEPMRGGVTKESWDAAIGLDTSHWQQMIAEGAMHKARSAPSGVTKERQKLLDLMSERPAPQEMIGVRYTGVPLPTDFDQMEHMRSGSTIPSLPISRPDLTHAVLTDGSNEKFGTGIWSYHNNAFAASHNARLTGGKVVALHYVDGSPKVDRGVRVQMNISMGPLDHGVNKVHIERETNNVVPFDKPRPESS